MAELTRRGRWNMFWRQPSAAVLWVGEGKQLSSNGSSFKTKGFRKGDHNCQRFYTFPKQSLRILFEEGHMEFLLH